MENVFIFDHPLIQHKISLMRDKRTTTKEFRELVSEVARLMAYEVTRDLPLKEVRLIRLSPRQNKSLPAKSRRRSRASGRGSAWLMDAESAAMARVGHIGLYRDPRR
jgi:uracil phosphoribosyltransferase